jgi:RNA polymerase sigma-70 factor (ECF subfamily)
MSRRGAGDRLDGISTDWDALRVAHGGAAAARAAQEAVILRYEPAIRRYLRRAAGTPDAAEEVFQEFGVAVVEGKLRGADPARGRFRDYVKAALRHLVAKYHAKRGRGPRSPGGGSPALETVPAPGPPDDRFDEAWRDALLARAWAALAAVNRAGYEALKCRAEHPELSSRDLAGRLAARLGRPLTAEGVRQSIHRAREQFARLLAVEVGRTLADPSADAVDRELAELGLLEYCRPGLGA